MMLVGSGVKLPKDWISEHASASVGQLTWPNLSPGLISTTDALVKSTDLIRPGVKLEITYTAQ